MSARDVAHTLRRSSWAIALLALSTTSCDGLQKYRGVVVRSGGQESGVRFVAPESLSTLTKDQIPIPGAIAWISPITKHRLQPKDSLTIVSDTFGRLSQNTLNQRGGKTIIRVAAAGFEPESLIWNRGMSLKAILVRLRPVAGVVDSLRL